MNATPPGQACEFLLRTSPGVRRRRAARVAALLLFGLVFCLVWSGFVLPAQAQPGAGRVVVTGVDDRAFPLVRLSVDVFDANGSPVNGLGAGDFTLREEGQPVAVTAVRADTSRPLALLLALDRSTDPATWSALQTTVAGAIAGLRSDDQIAITTFFDTVQPVLEFTTDKTAAVAALTGLAPGGEFSAVNPAAVDAVGRFTAAQSPRRAVVLVADAPDNISGLTTADAIARITGAQVPVYMVGVGPRVQGEPSFAALAEATGGRAFSVATADQLGTILALLIQELIQGYQVEFVSALPADGGTKTVTVAATGVGATGTGTFAAVPGEVTVRLSGLEAGSPVAGLVTLEVAVEAPAAVATIEARAGDVLIGATTDPAQPIAWDTSNLPAGPVTVRVTATDVAGNRGETDIPLFVANAAPRMEVVAAQDDAYPSLTLFVDAFGANGLPLVGLTAANFALELEGQQIPLTLQVDNSQPLQLVVAVDRSVSQAEWVQIRAAAIALADAMRPQDRMAVYTFGSGVSLLQAATGDVAALKAALAAVEPQAPANGEPTPRALHQAMLDSLTAADILPAGRRAVVVLAGGADTTGQIPATTLAQLLQDSLEIPLHLLAFGAAGNQAATLTAFAHLTGGNALLVDNAAPLRGAAQTLALLLQQGYRLDVQASLPADDRPHILRLTMNAAGSTVTVEHPFTARRGTVTVSIPGLAPGATLTGLVDVTAVAQAPAEITQVVYRLNGDVIAEVNDIATLIRWDSGIYPPGPYTLEVTVTDAVGNQGSASVAFTVVPPITLQARLGDRAGDGPLTVGDSITVDALPEAVGEVAAVEFFAGGVPVGTATQPPYRVVFDSSPFDAGTLEIRVVARDREGYEAVVVLPVELAAPLPTPTPEPFLPVPDVTTLAAGINWGRWLGIGGGAIGLLLLLFGFLSLLRSARTAAQQRKLTPMRLHLSNQGNVATAYLLRGEDPAGVLTFRFSMNGVPLGLPPVARLAREENGATVAAGSGPRAGGVRTAPPGAGPEAGTGSPVPKGLGEIGEKINEVSLVGRIIADILMQVSYFLPRSLAAPLRTVVMQIRRGQMMARRVQNVQRQIGRLNRTEMGASMVQTTAEMADEAGRYATSAETQQFMVAAGQGAMRTATSAATATAAGASRAANKLFDLTTTAARQVGDQAAAALGVAPAARQWVYVPTIQPGESVTIDVLVGAQGPTSGSRHHPFRILSRALGDEESRPMIEEGSVRVVGTSWWQRNLPRILVGVAGVMVVGAVWLAVLIWWA